MKFYELSQRMQDLLVERQRDYVPVMAVISLSTIVTSVKRCVLLVK